MENNNPVEAMLAELVELANEQKTMTGKLGKTLEVVGERLHGLEIANAPSRKPVSMITLKDHDDKMNKVFAKLDEVNNRCIEIKGKYDALLADRPFWATREWPIKALRWMHRQRYWWAWGIYLVVIAFSALMICHNHNLRLKNATLQVQQMKYRFVKATGFAPKVVQFLDDAYEEGQTEKIEFIETTVSEYEKALRHKADSIVRAEHRVLEQF